MARKKYFTKCFACFCGYSKCNPKRIPRKNKKFFKKFLEVTNGWLFRHFMYFPTSCDLAGEYNRDKKIFPIYNWINKNKSSLDKLKRYSDDTYEEIYINEKGRLCWYWEDDSDYGASSGIMPFCYSKEEAGNTWAFSEVVNLVEFFMGYPDNFQFPLYIKSDQDLLNFLNKLKGETK
jgi:hypothetical protein